MTYKDASRYEEEARRLNVSKVARSPRGFMRAYQHIDKGKKQADVEKAMKIKKVPGYNQTWDQRRHNFIRRWLPIYKKKKSRKIALSLAMWAYRVREL